MSLQTLMQSGPLKANELFAKLFDTSDGAIKTRERLFDELKAELELHASLEEQHLLPVLRRNAETKMLATDAAKDIKELRSQVAELAAMAKNEPAFIERMRGLQQHFRQHALDEKREVLPAVRQALDHEQMANVVEKVESGIAETELARHEETEARRARARAPAEQPADAAPESVTPSATPSVDVPVAAGIPEAAMHVAADAAAATAESMTQTGQDMAAATQTQMDKAVAAGRDIATDMTEQASRSVSSLEAVSTLPGAAIQSMIEIRSAWASYAAETAQAGSRLSRELLRQASDRQRQFAYDIAQQWITRNTKLMQMSLEFSGAAGLQNYVNERADAARNHQAQS